jgi:hypothetical protein
MADGITGKAESEEGGGGEAEVVVELGMVYQRLRAGDDLAVCQCTQLVANVLSVFP